MDLGTGILHACAPRRIMNGFHTEERDEVMESITCLQECGIPEVKDTYHLVLALSHTCDTFRLPLLP